MTTEYLNVKNDIAMLNQHGGVIFCLFHIRQVEVFVVNLFVTDYLLCEVQ
jgi:hypothetical protein